MAFFKNNAASINVISRVLIALLGGFILANLVAILISSLFFDHEIDGLVTGMMTSFIVYLVAVIFVFSTKTLWQALLGVLIVCVVVFSLITVLIEL